MQYLRARELQPLESFAGRSINFFLRMLPNTSREVSSYCLNSVFRYVSPHPSPSQIWSSALHLLTLQSTYCTSLSPVVVHRAFEEDT